MDLLTSFIAPDAAAAACSTACRPSGGNDGEPTGEQAGDFLATLAALLGPLHDEDGVAELAAAVADLESGDADDVDAAVASIWPLAVLAAGEAAARAPEAVPATPLDAQDAAESAGELPATDEAPSDGTATVPLPAGGDVPIPAAPPASTDDADADVGTAMPPAPVTDARAEAELETGPDTITTDGGDPAVRVNDASTVGAEPEPAAAGSAATAEAARVAQPAVSDDGDQPTVERTTRPGTPPVEQAAETSRPTAAATTADTPPAHATTRGSAPNTLGMADGIRRVLEAIELLENAPPPRQITIEVGEARLRVALEDGQVRLTVVDGADDTDELLAAAEDALAEHGFDLGGQGARDGGTDDRPTAAPTTSGASRPGTVRSVDRGLRL